MICNCYFKNVKKKIGKIRKKEETEKTKKRVHNVFRRTLVQFGNPTKVSILEVLISILEVLISILIGYSFHFGNGIHLIWKWYPLDLEMVST